MSLSHGPWSDEKIFIACLRQARVNTSWVVISSWRWGRESKIFKLAVRSTKGHSPWLYHLSDYKSIYCGYMLPRCAAWSRRKRGHLMNQHQTAASERDLEAQLDQSLKKMWKSLVRLVQWHKWTNYQMAKIIHLSFILKVETEITSTINLTIL